MKLRPLHDRVVVKRVEEETQTRGGLYIPESAKEKPARGKVTAVGAGKVDDDGERTPPELKEGDEVLFGKYAGSEIELGGIEYVILREDEVIGVVEA
jgi:chaperonin GroES